jgi:hypothetical protein
LLRRRCVDISEAEFHFALMGLVTGLRDAHTRYRGPVTLQGRVAALPFLIEEYGPGTPTYLVSKLADGARLGRRSFAPGVELLSWNGIPFDRAVDIYADRETGGRPDCRRSRALESFTFRALDYGPPPDERWVIIGYRTPEGQDEELRVSWRLVEPGRADTAVQPHSGLRHKVAADPSAEAVRRAKKLMFAPHLWANDRGESKSTVDRHDQLPTAFQDTLAARPIRARHGTLGYLRIWSFDVDDHEAFVQEVIRLVGPAPTERPHH